MYLYADCLMTGKRERWHKNSSEIHHSRYTEYEGFVFSASQDNLTKLSMRKLISPGQLF